MVDGNTTYKDWRESLSPEQEAALKLAQKKDARKTADKVQYIKYKNIYGGMDGFPKTFDKFQVMKYTDSEAWEKFKADKQTQINGMDFKDMSGLKGKLGNQEVRLWYKAHDANIPNLLDTSKTLEEQARQACELRNENRTNARLLMRDKERKEYLENKYPNYPFEYYYKKYKTDDKTDEEVYRTIIRKSTTTNKDADKKAGIE